MLCNCAFNPTILLCLSVFVTTTNAAGGVDLSWQKTIDVGLDWMKDEPSVLGKKKAPTEPDNVDGLRDPVLRLNRFTFQQTILEDHSDEIAHWIVLFCPPWYEPCQALDPVYRQLTETWQEQLNSALLTTEVRFAAVDCATEKALCNTQNVVTYPFVAHYRNRKQVSRWKGKSFETDKRRLKEYLQKELGPLATVVAGPGAKDSDDVTAEEGMKIPFDFLLIFAAIAGNAFFISRGNFGSQAASPEASSMKQPMEGGVTPSAPQADQRSSCVARALPKEWGRDRPSFEL